ncbi:MAG: hypothetical protein GXO79_06680 [Chlorobi bacterium]|nr:hypothetical protein [Chlorobiota bacterium]
MKSKKDTFTRLNEYYHEAKNESFGSLIELPPPKQIWGRSNIIDQIYNQWVFNHNNRVLIYGKIGVGKSALLINSAYSLLSKFNYETAIYLDLKSTSINLTSFEAFIRYLGVFLDIGEFNFRQGINERIAAIYRKTSVSKSLFVVDNFDNDVNHQIRDFILKLPFKVDLLVTSLDRLTDFPISYLLQNLDYKASQEMTIGLSRKIGIEVNTSEIFKVSEGHPKTISWVLNLRNNNKSMKSIIHEIKLGNTKLQKYYFDSIWSGIIKEVQNIFILFNVTDTFDLEGIIESYTIEKSTNITHDDLANYFSNLDFKGILVKVGENKYKMSSIASSYVQSRIDRNSAHIVYLTWFESISNYLDNIVSRSNWSKVFSFIEQYFNTITLSVVNKDIEESLKFRILNTFSYYLYSKGLWSELSTIADFYLKNHVINSDFFEYFTSSIPGWFVRSKIMSSQESQAQDIFNNSLTLLKKPISKEVKQFIEILNVSYFTNQADLTPELIKKTESISTSLLENGKILWSLQGRIKAANMWLQILDWENCMKNNNKVVSIISNQQNPDSWLKELLSIAKGNLGILYNQKGNYSLAEVNLLKIVPDLAQSIEHATVFVELSYCFYKRKKWSKSYKYFKKHLNIKNALEIKKTIMESFQNWDMEDGLKFYNSYEKYGKLYYLKLWKK